jgi:hypothetical protein
MKIALSPMFATHPTAATISGVLVSWRPRSSPVAAMTMSMNGSPHHEIAR